MNLDNVEERIVDNTEHPAVDDIDETDDDLGLGLDDDFDDDGFDEDDLDDLEHGEPEDEDTEDEGDEDQDDAEDEDVKPEPKKASKGKKKLSPAEIKLIALKKENQELRRKMRDTQDKKKAASLAKKYVDEGYDEDTARRYATQDIEQDALKQEVDLLRFERKNASVFAKYPEALDDIEDIMQKAQAANMTAEQVCTALYGRPTYDQNAIRAAKGESIYQTDNRGSSSAVRSAATDRSNVTKEERKLVRQIERRFNNGQPLPKEELEIIMKKVRKG